MGKDVDTDLNQGAGTGANDRSAAAATIKAEDSVDEITSIILRDYAGAGRPFVRVSRLVANGEPSFVRRYDLEGFGPEVLQADLGAGRYELDFFAPDATGHSRRVVKRPCRVDPEEHRPEREEKSVGEVVEQAMRPYTEALSKLIDRLDRPPRDDSMSFVKILELVKTLNPAPPQALQLDPLSLLEKMASLQEKFMPKPGAGNLSELREILEFADTLKSRGGGGDNDATHVIDNAIDKLAPVFHAAVMNEREKNQMANSQRGAGAGAGTVAPEPGKPAEALTHVQQQIKPYLGMLIQSAMAGEPAVQWSELIANRVPQEVLAPVLADPVGELRKIDARVEQHSEWFIALAADISEYLNGGDPESRLDS